MKYSILFALLCIIGALLVNHSLTNIDLIDWAKLDPVLETQRDLDNLDFVTQEETVETVVDLYRRGLLFNYLRVPALTSVLSGIFLTILGAVGFLHLIIDKLFYKKFYEKPNLLLAIRRSALWGALLPLLVLLGVLNYLTLALAVTVILIFALFELLLSSIISY